MKKILMGFIICLFCISNTYADITMSAANHPRIFVGSASGAETIAKLKSRCGVLDDSSSEYQDHAAEYALVKAVADDTDYDTVGEFDAVAEKNQARLALCNAFVYLMTGTTVYADRAEWILDNVDEWGYGDDEYFGIYAACIVYDWIYDNLSSAERTDYSGDISTYIEADVFYNTASTFQMHYNHRKYYSSIIALAGQAIYNEDAVSADIYWEQAHDMWTRMNTFTEYMIEDGFIYPIGGSSYVDESGIMPYMRMVQAFKYTGLAGTEITNLDMSVANGLPYGIIYSWVKDNRRPSHDDCINSDASGPWRGHGSELGLSFSTLAKVYEGTTPGILTSYILDKLPASDWENFMLIGEILFSDKDANAVGTTITDLAKTKVFDDTVVVYRSGWSDLGGDGTDVYFDFYCPKQVNGHTHFAKSHIDIWRGYDYLTFMAGSYGATAGTHYDYYVDSLNHNVFMVEYGSESTGDKPNEGGQLHNEGDGANIHQSSVWDNIDEREDGNDLDIGSIDRSKVDTDYFYAYYNAHAGKFMHATKMDNYSRSVVRAGSYFVVFDRFDGDAARTDIKRQIWHAPAGDAGIEGGSWSGTQPNEVDSSTRNFYWDDGGSRLHVYRVFPAPSASAYNRRIGGNGYEYYSRVESTQYDGSVGSNPFGEWRLEFEQTGQNDGHFLTILFPTSDSTSMPTIYTLGSASSGNFIGVEIVPVSGNKKVIIFSNEVLETKETSYSFSTTSNSGNCDFVIADLAADTYDVNGAGNYLVDSNSVFSYTADLSVTNTFSITSGTAGAAMMMAEVKGE